MPQEDIQTLGRVLRDNEPFRSLSLEQREVLMRAARISRYRPGDVILDAFRAPSVDVFVVITGQVDLVNDLGGAGNVSESLSAGGVFGFSAMLTGRSMGPRALAAHPAAVVAAIPAAVVEPVFASRDGARFLIEAVSAARQPSGSPYSLVDELILTEPLIVEPSTSVAEVARLISAGGHICAAVDLGAVDSRDRHSATGRYGLVTDALLRQRVLVDGIPGSAPAVEVMAVDVPVVRLGDSAAEALMLLLDRDAQFLLVLDHGGALAGMISPRDFVVSPMAACASIDEQIRRAGTTEQLQERARRIPVMLSDLLFQELATDKIMRIHAALRDTVVRRAIVLTFDQHPGLSPDSFTWLSLGSTGRSEPTLSSDMDSAVAFDDSFDADLIARYRTVFGQVDKVLAAGGLLSDGHGATAQHVAFARTNAAWRSAAMNWVAAPEENKGAVMTSLLVDGRPIYGDSALPAALEVFGELRRHPGTMRLLMREWLNTRARLFTMRDVFSRRGQFDIKSQAIQPLVNMARWAALSVGSTVLPTVERLRISAGSDILPVTHADNLIEAYEVLQHLRLRYQLTDYEKGNPPSDILDRDRMSPIDRSMVAQAVREIASVQRRMHNVSAYT